ncbi:hypothetical protein Tco_0291059 [Tanacetum coccineum]
MAFDLRPTEDVLPWPGNANMAFDLRPTEDVLPWPGNANMAFDLRPTEDVLPWPGGANIAFDLVPDLQCLLLLNLQTKYPKNMNNFSTYLNRPDGYCEYGIRITNEEEYPGPGNAEYGIRLYERRKTYFRWVEGVVVPNSKSGATSAKWSLAPEMSWHQNSVGVVWHQNSGAIAFFF